LTRIKIAAIIDAADERERMREREREREREIGRSIGFFASIVRLLMDSLEWGRISIGSLATTSPLPHERLILRN
jgi:hypothetical protein